MASSGSKKWGDSEFWGLSSDYDPDWILTREQKSLREKLIELCRVKIRPHAIHCDRTYQFPRESLDALADLGLLGLIVPKELGGLGESHVGATMVVETIARYGCPSTAMIYTMHLAACAVLLFRYHKDSNIQDLLRRLDKEKLVGSLSYSDPATGGHFWSPMSSKVKKLDNGFLKILKYGSWTTSAGEADWYAIQTISPDFRGDFSDLSCFLIYKDEVRASSDDWRALGLHGNQSGPVIVEGKFPENRLIGSYGEGRYSNDECVDIYFLLLSSGCWNGISMACMDIAKKHVTRKAHADLGMRICDYPTIQTYFGDCVTSTSVSRSHAFLLAQALDRDTNNNDWSLHVDPAYQPRTNYLHWLWTLKCCSAQNVNKVADDMLHTCGGSGYKEDLGLERLLRDSKAGWVMGPSNEVLSLFIGKSSLMGLDTIDCWEKNLNEGALNHELGKLTLSAKKILAQKLMSEVNQEESGTKSSHPYQDTDFENPFNTSLPHFVSQIFKTEDGITHGPGLNPLNWTSVSLLSTTAVNKNMSSFVFNLPNSSDHTGCLPGQYIQVKVDVDGRSHERYFSLVSDPMQFGSVELVIRFETRGIISQFFSSLKPGDIVDMKGPCGGFEYVANTLDELTLMASGGGIAPQLQLIRCILKNPSDKTRINLLYYSDSYEDILYREELDAYKAKDSRLKIIHTLGETPESWEGGEGFIDKDLIDKYVTKSNGIKHQIIICGGPTMVISCLYSLRSLKFPPEIIFIYGQFGTEQMRVVYGRNVKLSGHKCDNIV